MANNDVDAVKEDLLSTVFSGEDDVLNQDDELQLDDDENNDDDIPAGDEIDDEENLDEDQDFDENDALLDKDDDQSKRQKPESKKTSSKQQQSTRPVGDRSEQFSLSPQEISGKYSTDQQGNVVINGKIVARAGTERKVFEMFRNSFEQSNAQQIAMSNHIHKVVAAGKELKKRYDDLTENKNYGEKIGLDNAEQRQALDIAALAKQDPKTAVKKFLTLMQLNGTTLEDIGTDVPLDAKTVAEQAVAKYIQEQEARQKKEEDGRTTDPVDDPAYKEAQTFLEQNPAAAQYVVQLDEAKAKFPHLTYQQCWDLLQQGIKRAQTKSRGDQGNRGRKPRDPGTPPPNRGRKRTISSRNVTPDPNQSFKQIGADLLKELNIKE